VARLLSVSNLTVSVAKKSGLPVDDISFAVNEGEIIGLAGESGCGKTMTALSIVNLLPRGVNIHSGEIIYANRNLTTLSEKQMCAIRGREISFAFQEARQSLNPLVRVGNQITEMLELGSSVDKDKNKTNALSMLSDLGFDEPEKIYDCYPHQLSGGMCQRVMTAIAAVSRPRLLLADEPSSSQDAESQERILSLLMKMNREHNTAILIISHDLSIIRRFCNRFLVMYAGKIVEEGPASALYSPLHPYTSALIGAIPNKDKRGQVLENIHGKVPSIEDRLTGCPFAPRCKKAHAICRETFAPAIMAANGRRVHCYFPLTGETDE